MPPSRLSDADKQEILNLYQRGQETTTTLASRYGVSNSTIIRILKSFLSPDEYDALVQSKRSNGRDKLNDKAFDTLPLDDLPTVAASEPLPLVEVQADALELEPNSTSPVPKPKRRSVTSIPQSLSEDAEDVEVTQLPLMPFSDDRFDLVEQVQELQPVILPSVGSPLPTKRTPSPDEIIALETELLSELKHSRAISQEDLDADDADLDADDADLDDDFDADDEDDFDDEDSEADDEGANADLGVFATDALEIRPLEENSLPRTCYLVIDRTAELVTRPLKEFGELGAISNRDAQERILPVFDNHRIAKRFSNRSQRIIKVPDGRMLRKAAPQLQAKGITRLLIDGRVYTFDP